MTARSDSGAAQPSAPTQTSQPAEPTFEEALAELAELVSRLESGALGQIATLIGQHKANILGLRMDNRDTTFHTNTIDLEVRNAAHLMRLLAALRAEGCDVDDKVDESDFGKFGWVMDPDGNRIELWQPPAGQ